jgi:hypothetical protein
MRHKLLLIICALMANGIAVEAKVSAIIERWDTKMKVPAPNELVVTEFRRVKILEEDGYLHAVYHDYYDSFRKIKSLRYTLFDASNKKIKRLSKADAVDVRFSPSYEINDARLIYIDPEYRSYPFTVEVEVEIVYDGFIGFPLWMPRYFHDLEVNDATLELESYPDFDFRAREIKGVASPATSQNAESKVSRWRLQNLPAETEHGSRKLFLSDQPRVQITPLNFSLDKRDGNFSSWAQFGDWYIGLNEGRNGLSSETKLFLDELKATHKDDVATLVKTIYQFMQSKTRYISIQLGIGGFQTIPSDVVEKTGYGDCKALTNYMKAMLDHVKIPSYNVLVQAGRDVADIIPDFPSNQFNHVFLAVPQSTDTLWFECTSQSLPPTFLGTFTDDRHVLWVSKGSSKIVRTPTHTVDNTVMKRDAVIDLTSSGDAKIDLHITATGAFFDDAMVYQMLTKDRVEQFNHKKFFYNDFSISKFEYKVPDPNQPILELQFDLKVNSVARTLVNKLVLPYNLLTPIDHELHLDLLVRKCEVRRAYTINDDVKVRLPENYHFDNVPREIIHDTPFATFKMTVVGSEGSVCITRRLTMKKGIYEKEGFDAFYEAVRKIRALEQSKLVFISKT